MITCIKYIYRYTFWLFVVVFLCMTAGKIASADTLIQDDAGIIADDKQDGLRILCDKIYKEYNTSVYIWTAPNISGSMDFGYEMEQFVLAHKNTNVIILMIGMYSGDRIYEIQGYGTAKNMITDKRCNKILDYMYDDMADEQYYSAIEKFCNRAYTYMGKPPKFDSLIFSSLIQFILCLVLAIVSVALAAYSSSGHTTTNSRTYLDKNNSKVIGRFDRYTHTTVTRRPKPKSQSASGSVQSGSSSHSSGGGRSF